MVTGRYGFTGRFVAEELARSGWEVWGIGTHAPAEADPQFRTADLTDAAALADAVADIRPDAVVHLGAIAFVAHGNASDFYQVNVIGTRNLLGVLADGGYGQHGIVLASSANIYGNSLRSPISETADPAPTNDYAVSKLSMELVARLFMDRLPIIVTRPFNYTGRGQDEKFLLPKIVSHFRARAPRIELGNIDVARDFSDVRDVAKAYRSLLDAAPSGETVNICSGRATALQDVIAMCRTATGHDIEVAVNPAFVRSGEIKTLNGDSSRLEKLVGRFERHELIDTLRWMLDA
ncbi:MAG: GDP-mannose 4,6-dehydratase [Marinibacterium sp.]|nr:GDP-mannose 4,6-dehydratase [Marinibacterium sp.]